MFSDGLHWCTIISLPYQRNKNEEYLVERIVPQPELVKILRDLPVCTGVGIRRDVTQIEEFYSIISKESIELKRFLDFSGMAATA